MTTKGENAELALKDKGALPVKLDIKPEDTKGYNHEEPVLVYVKIRHKDLKGTDGRTVERTAGSFAFSDDRPDAKSLTGAFIGSRRGRVYFEKLEDSQPTCKSIDCQSGSHLREADRYGECTSCILGQFADGSTPKCREIRNLFFVEIGRNDKASDGYVLTLGPSGLRPWRIHDNAVLRLARKSNPGIEAAPHHLVKVKVDTEHKDKPAPHFVPVFEIGDIAGKNLADVLRKQREVEEERMEQAHRTQQYEAADFGGKPNDDLPF